MAPRRSPDIIALELLNCVEENGEATKWDLIKVLGNETQFRIWIENFFLREKVLVERREAGITVTRRQSEASSSISC